MNKEKEKPETENNNSSSIQYCYCGHRLALDTTKLLNGKLVCSWCLEEVK